MLTAKLQAKHRTYWLSLPPFISSVSIKTAYLLSVMAHGLRNLKGFSQEQALANLDASSEVERLFVEVFDFTRLLFRLAQNEIGEKWRVYLVSREK